MRLFRCLALLLSLAAPAAFAGGPYQVELVVFRQAGDAVPSSQPAPDDWATGAQPLASDALRATALDNQLAKLSQDNGYTVLLHKAWRQDIGETPVKIALSEGQEQDHHFPVEGTLTLSQVRFVDMEADFWVNRFGDDGFLAGSQHIRQGTRLKNGELTYLDHPSLGILIKVVPVGARPAAPNPMEMEEQQAPADAPPSKAASTPHLLRNSEKAAIAAFFRCDGRLAGQDPRQHLAHLADAIVQRLFDFGHGDDPRRLARRGIDHQRQAGVGQVQLAGQCRLGHAGHADDIVAVPLQPGDFRHRFQARPLGAGVDPMAAVRQPQRTQRLDQALAQRLVIGVAGSRYG